MANDTALSAIGRRSSVLDRAFLSSQAPLSEVQTLTDSLTSTFLQEATNLRTAAAMLGAGWVGRLTRMGAMTSVPGQTLLAQGIRWGSHVPALAAESAAFAGIERGFHRLEGHPVNQPFHRDWARAAVTLTGLKAFGGLTRGQNIILQHLTTDLGLVGSQHAAHAVGLTPRPQGSLAQQMLQAEATNLHMMGSMAFAHALSPGLSATERSLDLYLHSQEGTLSSLGRGLSISPELVPVAEGTSSSLPPLAGETESLSGPSTSFMSGRPKGGFHPITGEIADPIAGTGDPMEGRGIFIQSDGPRMGGGGGRSSKPLSADVLVKLFPSEGPPQDASPVVKLVETYTLIEPLSQGTIYAGQRKAPLTNVPAIYTLSLLPVPMAKVLDTLTHINETATWMPRLEWFRTVENDAMDPASLRRALQTQKSAQIAQTVEGRFKTTGPIFQGRFIFTYRNIPGGGTQMHWRLHESQEFQEKGSFMQMNTNNSSFTLVPAPHDSNQTLLAYSLHVETSPLLNSILHFFLPKDQIAEQPSFILGLLNRSIDSSWNGKARDSLGLQLSGVPNPSRIHYSEPIKLK